MYDKIKTELGWKPSPPAKVEKPYVAVKVDGDIAYVSGNIAFSGSDIMYKGRIGDTVSVEDGKKSAALAMINCLELLEEAGLLDRVTSVLKVTGYLCCAEHITELPTIMNAGSQVLVDVFGEAGKHARAALGMYTLPLGASVEVELVVKLGGS